MLFFIFFILNVFAQTQPCGEKLTWTITDFTLIISGTGDMTNFDNENNPAPWSDVATYIYNNVIIEKGVTSIGDYAFTGLDIQSVTFENNSELKRIGKHAFEQCGSLSEITIPASVQIMEELSFYGCGITSFLFQENSQLTTIGDSVFGSLSITELSLPANVKTIGNYVFEYCYDLETLNIPSAEVMGNELYTECYGLTSITLPKNLKSFGFNTFQETEITDIYVAEGCENFESIDGVLYQKYANGKELVNYPRPKHSNEIVIPEGVTSIRGHVFEEYYFVESVQFPSTLKEIKEYAFHSVAITTLQCNEGLETIGDSAFLMIDSLETVHLSSTVKNIAPNAFYDCTSISTFTVAAGNTVFESIDNILFAYNRSILIKCAPKKQFTEKYVVPNTVKVIYGRAFESNPSLPEIEINGIVEQIRTNAFSNCGALTKVTIKAPVNSVGSNVFSGCRSLQEVILSDDVKMIGSSMFSGCEQLKTFTMSKNIYTIETHAFDSTSISSIVIPDTTVFIESYAFNNCPELISVTIGKNVREISNNAFESCKKLETVTINSETLYRIDDKAFKDCISLKTIVIPSSVKIINEMAFIGCSQLTTVNFKGDKQPNYCAPDSFESTSVNSVTVGNNYNQQEFCGVTVNKN